MRGGHTHIHRSGISAISSASQLNRRTHAGGSGPPVCPNSHTRRKLETSEDQQEAILELVTDDTYSERLEAILSELEDLFIDINTEVLKDKIAARQTSRKWLLMLKKHELIQVAAGLANQLDDPEEDGGDEEEEESSDESGE